MKYNAQPGYFESAWQTWYLRQVLGIKKRITLQAADYLKHLTEWTDVKTLHKHFPKMSRNAVQQELLLLHKKGLVVRVVRHDPKWCKNGKHIFYRANDLG